MNINIDGKNQPTIQLEAFESYCGSGWQPIPLHAWDSKIKGKSAGKRPRDLDWTRRDYDAAKVIKACIANGWNMGVRLTARQLVIDVDLRHGGKEGFIKLCGDLGIDATQWPCVETGSGGWHFYLLLPEDVRIVDTLPDYSGVEFKSLGRQVVSAGSVHPETGRHYFWDGIDHPPLADAPEAPPQLVEAIQRPERSEQSTGGGQYSQEQIAATLEKLDVTKFQDHDQWLRLMMACHHASNGDARSEFLEWSTQDPAFANDAEIIGRRWDSLHKNKMDGITVLTLNKYLRDAGQVNAQLATKIANDDFDNVETGDEDTAWLEGGASTSTEISRVESRGLKLNKQSVATDTYENALCAVVQSKLSPAWDELKQNVIFRTDNLPWDESYGRILNDHVSRLIRMYFVNLHQGVAFSPSKDNLFEALMTIAYGDKFNPVRDYLDSLKWDGTERVAQLFPHYFKCGDDAYTRAVSRCFMIAAVRRMRKPGCKFDTMPILRSPQGWLKSTAVKMLFGAQWYSDADLGSLRDKDSAMKLRGIWVQEFAEMESLTRSETGTLKAFCSRATDRQRDPYGRIVEDAPRRCVFVSTVNEGGYLKDSTGARRFWPLEVAAPIDVARIAADRDQLWAEAAALEAQGASDVLPRELWPVAAQRQAEQTSDDPWADTLQAFLGRRAADFKADRADDDYDTSPLPPDRVHTEELFSELRIDVADRTKDKAQRAPHGDGVRSSLAPSS
jgi:hypothetical protein